MAVPSLPPFWLEDDLPIQLDISLSRSLPPSLCSPSPSLSTIPTNTYTIPSNLYKYIYILYIYIYRNIGCRVYTRTRERGNTRPLDVSSILLRRRPVKFNDRSVNALLAGYKLQFAVASPLLIFARIRSRPLASIVANLHLLKISR